LLLSIIIVNFRSAHLVVDCINSIKDFNLYLPFEVLVVDNNSGDNSEAIISSHFPDVTFIQMGYNSGFARANNIGMKAASGDVFLLLNADTICIDDSITECFKTFVKSNYVAIGIQLLDMDQNPSISGNYFVKGGLNHLMQIPYWGELIRWIGHKFKLKSSSILQAKAIEEVDWISGAFLMVKKQTTNFAGLMDEDIFLYAEEVEWCSRLRKWGKLCILGNLHIIHLEGRIINPQFSIIEKGYHNLYDQKGLQLIVSNHLRVRKQDGPFWFVFLLLNYSWGLIIFGVCSICLNLFRRAEPLKDWRMLVSFAKNIFKVWQFAPRIISNKPYFYKMLPD
jgi:GT2 family glycosyltransferase